MTASEVDIYTVKVRGETVAHTPEFGEVVRLAIAAGVRSLDQRNPTTWEGTDGNGGIVTATKHVNMKEDEWLA